MEIVRNPGTAAGQM